MNQDHPQVKIVKKQVEVEEWECPQCSQRIGEKELFSSGTDNLWKHGPCGGVFSIPPSDFDLGVKQDIPLVDQGFSISLHFEGSGSGSI